MVGISLAIRRLWCTGGGIARPMPFLFLLLVLTSAAAPRALAQCTAPSAAQSRALESLEFLRRGESAADREEKRRAFQRGVELARQAIALDDNNADAHFAMFANRGRLMELDGLVVNPFTLVEATRELDRTLEIDPNHTDALAAKGGIYRQLPWVLGGSKQKASEYLARSVELDYENACGARIELAELYRDLGQPQRSIALLQKAIEIAERDNKPDKLRRARALLRDIQSR